MGVDRSGLLVAASALNDHAAGLRRAADRLGAAGSEARQAEIGIAASWVSPESDAFRGRLRVVSDALSAAVPAPGESSAASMRLSGTAEQIAGILGSLDQEFAALESELRALTSQPIGPCDPPPDTSAVEHRMRSNRERRRAVESEWATECARTRAEFDRATEAVDRARARLHSDAPTEVRATGVIDPVSGPIPIHPLPVPSFEEVVGWLIRQADRIAKAYMELWKKLGLWVRTVSPGVNLLLKVLTVVGNVLIAWDGIKELFGGAWKDPDAALIDRLASGLLIVAGGLAIAALIVFTGPVAAALSAAAAIVWAVGKAIKHREVVFAWTQAIWSTAKAVAGVVWELLKDRWLPQYPLVPLAEEAWNWVKDKAGQVWDWTSDVWESRWDLAREAWDRFLRFIDRGAALILSTAKALLTIGLLVNLIRFLPGLVIAGLGFVVSLAILYLVLDKVLKVVNTPTTPQTAADRGELLREDLAVGIDVKDVEAANLAVRLSEMGPEDVRVLVSTLPPGMLDRLIENHPDIIGILDGMPSHARTRANEIQLKRDIVEARRRGNVKLADELTQLWVAAGVASGCGLRGHSASLKSPLGDVEQETCVGGLYTYRSDHPDRYVMVVGNPDTACRTTVFVPGTLSDAEASLDYAWSMSGVNAAISDASGCETATFVYNDYDTPRWYPPGRLPTDATLAEAAAPDFARFLTVVSDANPSGAITLFGHSAGCTVIGKVLDYNGPLPEIEGVILWASAGLGVDQLSDLTHVAGGRPPFIGFEHGSDIIQQVDRRPSFIPSSLGSRYPDGVEWVDDIAWNPAFGPVKAHHVIESVEHVQRSVADFVAGGARVTQDVG